MKNRWDVKEAKPFLHDPLKLRVYTSRLLGQEPNLVLHGGGNTSVKAFIKDKYGKKNHVLYVKGSGWDLATIKEEGFAPVRMDALLKMAEFKDLSDSEMVYLQRAAMMNPYAPNPSVEAILHALIPFSFVDHTHADSVVAITNTSDGRKRIYDVYGDSVLYVPYVMPGFILARKVYEMTRHFDWAKCKGVVLLNHGIFSFDDDGKASYDRMISLVSKAENYLKKKKAVVFFPKQKTKENLLSLARLRKSVSAIKGSAVVAKNNTSNQAVYFSELKNLSRCAGQGPLTPDHVIRTKRVPVILKGNIQRNIGQYTKDYKKYFNKHKRAGLTMLDAAPRWAVWPQHGTVSFADTFKEAGIIDEIIMHTIHSILSAEKLGGWKALPSKDIFDVEYWELEQAKLKKALHKPEFQGKIVLVTGAASGIGRASLEEFYRQGACVVGIDINPQITALNKNNGMAGIICDMTKEKQIKGAVEQTVRLFGGLDIIVSNAGTFPLSERIENVQESIWQKSLDVNLTSHQFLLKCAVPYLKEGIDPAVIVIASKNVPAPGPGASAYSVAKAGLTQLARVAALELAPFGIRVNVVHPNAVFDTGIWTEEVLQKRAKNYHMSVEEYKKSNLLKTEVSSKDVARLVCSMSGHAFSKTTGAQVPIDGGNERVI